MKKETQAEEHSLREYIVAGSIFTVCSVSMILVNKGAVRAYSFTGPLLILQNGVTLLLLLGWKIIGKQELRLQWDLAQSWFICCCFFCVNIFSSLEALKYVTIPTFTVFRNLNSLNVSIGEYFVMGKKTTLNAVLALLVIIVGTFIYAYNDLNFNLYGYICCLIHICSMACYSISVKKTNNSLKINSFEMSLYNNMESLPFLLVDFLFVTYNQDPFSPLFHVLSSFSLNNFFVVSSCFLAFTISVSGFMSQKVFSATAWITLNNINKIPALILSAFIFHDQLTLVSILGLSISLVGGYLYSYFSLQPSEPKPQHIEIPLEVIPPTEAKD